MHITNRTQSHPRVRANDLAALLVSKCIGKLFSVSTVLQMEADKQQMNKNISLMLEDADHDGTGNNICFISSQWNDIPPFGSTTGETIQNFLTWSLLPSPHRGSLTCAHCFAFKYILLLNFKWRYEWEALAAEKLDWEVKWGNKNRQIY